jgi:hypothetical protein
MMAIQFTPPAETMATTVAVDSASSGSTSSATVSVTASTAAFEFSAAPSAVIPQDAGVANSNASNADVPQSAKAVTAKTIASEIIPSSTGERKAAEAVRGASAADHIADSRLPNTSASDEESIVTSVLRPAISGALASFSATSIAPSAKSDIATQSAARPGIVGGETETSENVEPATLVQTTLPLNVAGTFRDSIAAFAEHCASFTRAVRPATTRQAWEITGLMLAADAMLIGRWLASHSKAAKSRRKAESPFNGEESTLAFRFSRS